MHGYGALLHRINLIKQMVLWKSYYRIMATSWDQQEPSNEPYKRMVFFEGPTSTAWGSAEMNKGILGSKYRK